MPPSAGSDAAIDIKEEFGHRAWHENVQCVWNGAALLLWPKALTAIFDVRHAARCRRRCGRVGDAVASPKRHEGLQEVFANEGASGRTRPGSNVYPPRDTLARAGQAAIFRLFKACPQIDPIDMGILEPVTNTVIMVGQVTRSALSKAQRLPSIRMRLLQLGLKSYFPVRASLTSPGESEHATDKSCRRNPVSLEADS